MARQVVSDPTTVSQMWRARGLQPHRVEYFKLSTNPAFVEKLRDVVGLYVDALSLDFRSGRFVLKP
ncbi:MAG: hypothetical protein R2832_00655 [Rhodothermales bacterium]